MVLSDQDIKEAIDTRNIIIDPFDSRLLKRNSYLLRLDNLFRVIKADGLIDTANPKHFDSDQCPLVSQGSIILTPDTFVLGCSLERIAIPDTLVGVLSGISNVARLGVQIHATSQFINAGYGQGHPSKITFELSTVGSMHVKLYYNTPICHLMFLRMSKKAEYSIPSARTGQDGPEISNLFGQFSEFIIEGKLGHNEPKDKIDQ